MKNFLAFQLSDNDFHHSLQKAIEYVMDNQSEYLTADAWRTFVVRGTVAFQSIRRIDNWFAEQVLINSTNYIDSKLKVIEVDRLDELPSSFEGVVYDRNLIQYFYKDYTA